MIDFFFFFFFSFFFCFAWLWVLLTSGGPLLLAPIVPAADSEQEKDD